MLAQRARLLAFYAGLVYNLRKHKITTEKTQHVQKAQQWISLLTLGKKILPAQKLSIPYKEWAILFITHKRLIKNKNKKEIIE